MASGHHRPLYSAKQCWRPKPLVPRFHLPQLLKITAWRWILSHIASHKRPDAPRRFARGTSCVTMTLKDLHDLLHRSKFSSCQTRRTSPWNQLNRSPLLLTSGLRHPRPRRHSHAQESSRTATYATRSFRAAPPLPFSNAHARRTFLAWTRFLAHPPSPTPSNAKFVGQM